MSFVTDTLYRSRELHVSIFIHLQFEGTTYSRMRICDLYLTHCQSCELHYMDWAIPATEATVCWRHFVDSFWVLLISGHPWIHWSPHTLQKEFPEMPMQEGQSQNVHILQTICHCTVFVNTDITFLCFFVSQSLQCVSTSSPYCHLFLLWFKPLSEWSRGLQCLVVTIVVIWRWINKLKLKSVLMTHRSLSLPQRL